MILKFIWLYRRMVSPLLGAHCRFYPSCSAYAETAFQQHGFFRAGWLSFVRLLKCNPWNPGGHDPVL